MKITLTRNVPASEEPPEVEVEVPALPRVGDEVSYANGDRPDEEYILIEGPVDDVSFTFDSDGTCVRITVSVRMPVDAFDGPDA
jgi:hypothetical protein